MREHISTRSCLTVSQHVTFSPFTTCANSVSPHAASGDENPVQDQMVLNFNIQEWKETEWIADSLTNSTSEQYKSGKMLIQCTCILVHPTVDRSASLSVSVSQTKCVFFRTGNKKSGFFCVFFLLLDLFNSCGINLTRCRAVITLTCWMISWQIHYLERQCLI